MKNLLKITFIFIFILLYFKIYSSTTTYNTVYNVYSNTTLAYGDTIILEAGISISDNITFTNNGVVISTTDLTISTGNFINGSTGVIDIDGYNITVASPQPTWAYPHGCHFINNGVININNGNFSLYPSDNPYNETIGVSFKNNGVMNLTDCEFTIRNNNKWWASFVNEIGGIVNIDNLISGKDVYFGLLTDDGVQMCAPDDAGRLATSILISGGSEFNVKNADLNINLRFPNPNTIEGNIVVEDGNVYIRDANGGGGTVFTIDLPLGGLFISDTDDSGDGLLSVSAGGGNTTLNIDGTLYTEGIITEAGGGGNNIYVSDGGFAFVGNMGASMVDQFTMTVQNGGTLNYCGNVVRDFADNVGNVEIGGTLNYAQSFYTSDPLKESDFTVVGVMYPLYADSASCVAAFNNGISNLGGGSLPINLTNFEYIDGYLQWETSSETNNDYFTVYESYDGINWYEITKVKGHGTTTTTNEYTLDVTLNRKLTYFKLRQTDYNGYYEEFEIISVSDENRNLTIVHDMYFTLLGQLVSKPEKPGYYINIIKYSDGKIVSKKIYVK